MMAGRGEEGQRECLSEREREEAEGEGWSMLHPEIQYKKLYFQYNLYEECSFLCLI